jgi:hypothetical protein
MAKDYIVSSIPANVIVTKTTADKVVSALCTYFIVASKSRNHIATRRPFMSSDPAEPTMVAACLLQMATVCADANMVGE